MRGYQLHKKAFQVFDKWQLHQDVFHDTITYAKKRNNQRIFSFYDALQKEYQNSPGALQQLAVLMGDMNEGPIYSVKKYSQLALEDTQKFIDVLKKNLFSTKDINKEECLWPINRVIKKYNKFLQLLFIDRSRSEQNRLLYLLANNFFTFCFDPANHCMDRLTSQQQLQPLARMLYSLMWKHLGSRGWQSWHQKTIDTLKKSINSKELVYIAGGSDIHQLLKHTIYNIRIIDPFLPTQDTYYSSGWKFLVKGIPGDTIEYTYDNHTLVLRRRSYQENGTFMAELSNGKKRRVPRATIIWDIYNDNQEKYGSLIIERRFVEQCDFSYDKNKKILFSFNELYFITTAHEDSWGIDVKKFDTRHKIYIKQLGNSLSKKMLVRMREIDEKFAFIQLGNCIN